MNASTSAAPPGGAPGGQTPTVGGGHAPRPTPLVLRPLRALDAAARRVEVVVLVVVLVTMITLSFAQVLLRIWRDSFGGASLAPVPWFDLLTRFLVLWVGMVGASLATREGRHFGVEALPKLFSERGRRRLEGILNLIGGGVAAVLTLIMWNVITLLEMPLARDGKYLFTIEAIQVADSVGGGSHSFPVARWWLLVVMPVSLALMSFRFFLRALESWLLNDEEWHALERELKPDVYAAMTPVAPAGTVGAPGPAAAASPAAAAAVGPGTAGNARKGERSTDEVKTYRLGDLADVEDPELRAGGTPPPDAEEALVDSDMVMAAGTAEDEATAAAAATERQPKANPDAARAAAPRPAPDGPPPTPGAAPPPARAKDSTADAPPPAPDGGRP